MAMHSQLKVDQIKLRKYNSEDAIYFFIDVAIIPGDFTIKKAFSSSISDIMISARVQYMK
jgi:hypothetical protein